MPASRPSGPIFCRPGRRLIELVGHTGQYDYVEFIAEYAPFDLHELDNLGRALEVANLAGMMKIEQAPRDYQTMRALGSGFQNVLFADVRTVEDAACLCAPSRRAPGSGGIARRGDAARRRRCATRPARRASSRRWTRSS